MTEQGREADGVPRDPGLALERTTLAWSRSGLAVLVAVAILTRRSQPWAGGWSIVAIVLLVAGAGTWVAGMLFGRRSRLRQPSGPLVVRIYGSLTVGTLLLAGAGLVLGLAVSP